MAHSGEVAPMDVDRPTLGCFDCGAAYSGVGWCDVVIPNEDWIAISPTGNEGGILCFGCIARRLERVGRSDVPMLVTSGPFERDPRAADGQWLNDGAPAKASFDESVPCGCHRCRAFAASLVKDPITQMAVMGGMILCPICGNKRCPHATDHRLGCTNSNEPSQPGSRYGGHIDRSEHS